MKVWPLALMALIVGLAAALLVIKFVRPEDVPPVPERTPKAGGGGGTTPVPVVPTLPTPVPSNPSVSATPDPTIDLAARQRLEAARKLLEDARKRIGEGKLEEARELIKQARQTRDEPEAEELERTVTTALIEKARRERERLEALLADVRSRVETFKESNRWDAALAAIESASQLSGHPDYESLRQQVVTYRSTAAQSFASMFKEAQESRVSGRLAAARERAGIALRIYPEREDARKFISDVEQEMQRVNMVRVPPPPKGVVLKLGDPGRADEASREYAGTGFLIDKFEATNEEYQVFVEATGHRPPRSRHWVENSKRAAPGYERYPVIGVTAADAESFATWAGKRLPTEDEWEYAARYLDGRTFPWGFSFQVKEAIYQCNSFEFGLSRQAGELVAVGTFAGGKSALDVFDLAGNAWEWTSTAVVPSGAAGRFRVLKGGSFMTRNEACRASNRLLDDPELAHHDVGFRCVRDLQR